MFYKDVYSKPGLRVRNTWRNHEVGINAIIRAEVLTSPYETLHNI